MTRSTMNSMDTSSNDEHLLAAKTLLMISDPGLQKNASSSPTEKRKTNSFPFKLFTLLSDDTNTSTITWLPDKKSFVILNEERFISHVLPYLFSKNTPLSRFLHELLRWGFKSTSLKTNIIFTHALFSKDEPDMLELMTVVRPRKMANIVLLAQKSECLTPCKLSKSEILYAREMRQRFIATLIRKNMKKQYSQSITGKKLFLSKKAHNLIRAQPDKESSTIVKNALQMLKRCKDMDRIIKQMDERSSSRVQKTA